MISIRDTLNELLLCDNLDGTDKRLSAFLTQIGICIHNADGSFKSTEKLLAEIAEVWKTIQND